jgi:cytochrome b involved in lipid metabolism
MSCDITKHRTAFITADFFFCLQHPGGEEILLEYAGRDATLAFRGIGHEVAMLQTLERCFLGILPESERIYSTPGGKLAGLKHS